MTGITVRLHVRTEGAPDAFNDATFTDTTVDVANVIVGEPTAAEVTSSVDLYGKKAEFMLGIPKGDTHDWEDTLVEFFGQTWQTVGPTIMGIESNVPTPWHRKIRVARNE